MKLKSMLCASAALTIAAATPQLAFALEDHGPASHGRSGHVEDLHTGHTSGKRQHRPSHHRRRHSTPPTHHSLY
jgi:hypothetical protein